MHHSNCIGTSQRREQLSKVHLNIRSIHIVYISSQSGFVGVYKVSDQVYLFRVYIISHVQQLDGVWHAFDSSKYFYFSLNSSIFDLFKCLYCYSLVRLNINAFKDIRVSTFAKLVKLLVLLELAIFDWGIDLGLVNVDVTTKELLSYLICVVTCFNHLDCLSVGAWLVLVAHFKVHAVTNACVVTIVVLLDHAVDTSFVGEQLKYCLIIRRQL